MLPIQLILDDKWSCCYVCMLQVLLKFVYQYLLMVSWAMEKLWGTLAILVHPPRNLFFYLFYWFTVKHCPVGTDTNGRLYPMRGDSPPPPPPLIGCRSLIPQPTEDGGRSVKVLLDGAYGFFISLRGIEWLSNHSWTSVESFSHQWVTLTANGRLRFRISQNGNEPIRTVQNNSHEESNVKHLFAWKNSLTQVNGKLGHVAQVDVCCLLFSAVSVTLNLSTIVGPVGSRSWAFLLQKLVLCQFNF